MVWTVDTASGTVYGFSVATGHQAYSFPLGSVIHLCTLASGDGWLFVAGNDEVFSSSLGIQ